MLTPIGPLRWPKRRTHAPKIYMYRPLCFGHIDRCITHRCVGPTQDASSRMRSDATNPHALAAFFRGGGNDSVGNQGFDLGAFLGQEMPRAVAHHFEAEAE